MQDEITKAIVAAIEPQLYAAEMAETVPIAERAALAAVEADREDACAHHRLAYTICSAAASTMRWLTLNPNFAMAHAFTA